VREERIELALLKLAVGDTFLNVNEDEHDAGYSIALQTSLYAIQKELGNKYSKAEIKDGLDILSLVRFKVEGPERSEDAVFSPIDKAYQATANGDARLFIRFNSLITRGVVRHMWRQVDYQRLLGDPSYLSRWFRKRFSLKYVHAEKGSVQARYHLNLSTIIAESGIGPYARLSQAHGYVAKVLDGLDDILDGYKTTKKFESGRTGGRVLVDVTYDFFPTHAFTQEQKSINKQALVRQLRAEARQTDMFRE